MVALPGTGLVHVPVATGLVELASVTEPAIVLQEMAPVVPFIAPANPLLISPNENPLNLSITENAPM